MLQVLKRDGEVADFDLRKINLAVKKAFEATEKVYTEDILDLLVLRVTADFQSQLKEE